MGPRIRRSDQYGYTGSFVFEKVGMRTEVHYSKSINFVAIVIWKQPFNCLFIKRRTTIRQKAPADVIPKLVRFVLYLRSLRVPHKFNSDAIFAMDETARWCDMPSDATVHHTGARSVVLKSTVHQNDHFTVILSAKVNGAKIKPFVVFKGKGTRLLKTLMSITGIAVKLSPNGWMNDSLTIEYFHAIIGSVAFTKRLLVWDAYKCHTSKAVSAEISRMIIITAVIPGVCTKYIQAPDFVWNATFKSHLRRCYGDGVHQQWKSEAAVSFVALRMGEIFLGRYLRNNTEFLSVLRHNIIYRWHR